MGALKLDGPETDLGQHRAEVLEAAAATGRRLVLAAMARRTRPRKKEERWSAVSLWCQSCKAFVEEEDDEGIPVKRKREIDAAADVVSVIKGFVKVT